jgi:hypothetical protein
VGLAIGVTGVSLGVGLGLGVTGVLLAVGVAVHVGVAVGGGVAVLGTVGVAVVAHGELIRRPQVPSAPVSPALSSVIRKRQTPDEAWPASAPRLPSGR